MTTLCPVIGTLNIQKDGTNEEFYEYIEKLKEYEDQTLEDSYAPPRDKPDWFDPELFVKGQKFALKYYFSVNFGEMLSLYLLFSHSTNLSPLIYTRKSDSTVTASKRYFRTILRVLSWFRCDLWDEQSEAYKNLREVRCLHLKTSKQMNSLGPSRAQDELRRIKAELNLSSKRPQYLDPVRRTEGSVEDIFENSPVFINQVEMTLTLFGFMGLVVLYPKRLGIHGATDDDLFAFVHLWRVIGHMLGIRDDVNFCSGSLSDVRRRCENFLHYYYKPKLYKVETDWEHMSKCMAEGIHEFIGAVTFHDTLVYLFWMLDLKFEQFWRRVSWFTVIRYYIKRLVLQLVFRINFIKDTLNFLLIKKLTSLDKSKYGR